MTAYNNPATREDKAEALRNERRLRRGDREPSTYHKLAGLADDLSGRFAVEAGQSKSTEYPRQNSESPWSGSGADPGVEPPTGVAIDAMEPCGEAFEQLVDPSLVQTQSRVDQRLSESAADGSGPPPTLVEDVALTSVVSTPATDVVETASTNPPDDGLDVPRRGDGYPLSSHTHALTRRKVT
jgi:hypothetical protein